MPVVSPYDGIPEPEWLAKTKSLIKDHPLEDEEIVDAVLESWTSIFESKIGKHGIRIGEDLFPTPQVMGMFLHELVPLELAARHPQNWRGDLSASEKDLVYLPDDSMSVEIKTSSNADQIFANRSYAQQSTGAKKSKDGFYIAVNFEKFPKTRPVTLRPKIKIIRFGWLEHTDWIGQASQSGQQARLLRNTYITKFALLYKDGQRYSVE